MSFSRSTHLLECLYLETSTSIISNGYPILVELLDLLSFVTIFLSQTTLFRWLRFLLGSLTVTLTVLLFWIYLFLLTLVFVLQWLSLYWENLIMLPFQFPFTFHQTHNEILGYPFHHIAYDYSRPDWDGFRDHLRDYPWGDIFKLIASDVAS